MVEMVLRAEKSVCEICANFVTPMLPGIIKLPIFNSLPTKSTHLFSIRLVEHKIQNVRFSGTRQQINMHTLLIQQVTAKINKPTHSSSSKGQVSLVSTGVRTGGPWNRWVPHQGPKYSPRLPHSLDCDLLATELSTDQQPLHNTKV